MGIIIDRMGIGKFGTEGGDIMDFYGVCILILVLYGIGLLIGSAPRRKGMTRTTIS